MPRQGRCRRECPPLCDDPLDHRKTETVPSPSFFVLTNGRRSASARRLVLRCGVPRTTLAVLPKDIELPGPNGAWSVDVRGLIVSARLRRAPCVTTNGGSPVRSVTVPDLVCQAPGSIEVSSSMLSSTIRRRHRLRSAPPSRLMLTTLSETWV